MLSNCITMEKPQNRTILIIRELTNFHSDTLQECLCAMEKAKGKEITLPIILETSESLWSEVLAVKISRLSFRPYYIQEMQYEEGIHYLVKSGLCTLEEYDMMYEKLGGHTGSYQELWHTIKLRNCTISNALVELERKAYGLLLSCIFLKPDLDTASVLKILLTHNYSMHIKEIPPSVKHLIECNILYFNEKTIQPQNKLLMYAMKEFLNMH